MKPISAKRTGLLAIFASLLAVTVWLATFKLSPRSPTYGGKTVQEWFYGDTGHPGIKRTIAAAEQAFGVMGTNCVPYLLNKVRSQETVFNRAYCWIHPRLPPMMQKKLKPPLSASYIQMVALSHLRKLASQLNYLTSDLMAIVPTISDNRAREQAFNMVEILVFNLEDVDRKKAFFVSFLRDPDFRIQFDSAIMLSRVDPSFLNTIPILVDAVTNKVLMNSIFTNGFYPQVGGGAQIEQKMAHEALGKIAPSLAARYEVPK